MSEADLQEIRQLAREFAAAELRPHTEAWDHDGAFDPAVLAQLAELGFLGMLVPEVDGGLGFTLPQYMAVLEELAWGEPGVALAVAESTLVSALVAEGTGGAVRQRWLDALAGGQSIGTRAVAEAQGSDAAPAAAGTGAEAGGQGWLLNGRKAFVPGAATAGVLAVLAGTGQDGTGLFLVPKATAGVSLAAGPASLGLRTLGLTDVELAGVTVEEGARVGEDGLQLLAAVAATARLAYAAVAVGIGQAALDHAIRYADEREQFGRPIRAFEGIQFKLADMAAGVGAARAATMAAATLPGARVAAEAKLTASSTAMKVSNEAVQIFGGYGYMRDYPVEKLMRDAKATEILEGSSEILRVEIARGLYQH
ncbi:MAG: acyl-CoA dehydrogenase family protein [Gemmatimonadota bacterium]